MAGSMVQWPVGPHGQDARVTLRNRDMGILPMGAGIYVGRCDGRFNGTFVRTGKMPVSRFEIVTWASCQWVFTALTAH